MKKQITSFAFSALFLSAGMFFTSCSREDDKTNGDLTFNSGILVTNEGQFRQGNGAVSFISKQNNEVTRDVFMTVNNRPLGDVVQSLTEHDGKVYMVVNNSEKIEIADARTFKEAGVIGGLKMPRYAVASGRKLYVTEWVSYGVSGRVAVINLDSNTVSKTITVGQLPDRMLLQGDKLYVLNNGENTVSVINTKSEVVENTIQVGDSPNGIVLASGNIWVLCGGNKVYGGAPDYALDPNLSTAGSLVKIDPVSGTVTRTLNFTSKADLPINLATNAGGNKLYYNAEGKFYQLAPTDTALATTSFINRNFSGLGISPESGNIFGAVSPSFSSNGKVICYNSLGVPVDSFTVGIGPNNIYFRK